MKILGQYIYSIAAELHSRYMEPGIQFQFSNSHSSENFKYLIKIFVAVVFEAESHNVAMADHEVKSLLLNPGNAGLHHYA